MIRASFVVIVLLVLIACGSQPVKDHYYSLVLAAEDVTAPARIEEANVRLIVGPIQLPEYLKRRGIAIQVDSNEIQTANHHFWAEPLDEAIAKVLVRDITDRASGITVDRDAGRWTGPGDCRLRIEFDKFHATDRGYVVASGRYWFSSSGRDAKQEFDFTQDLTADGHASAVQALRQSLQTLAAQISDSIDIRSQCAGEEPGQAAG